MTTKHTFLSLCDEYDKIEIPIIQRNYAQGRTTEEVTKVRNKFVEYVAEKMATNTPIELDFVYGNVRLDSKEDDPSKKLKVFVPIDGQQRLTTLFLLHWYLAVKSNILSSLSSLLSKFVYETRPSAHTFCERLINESFDNTCLKNIDSYIEDQSWFDNEWLRDGTVSGMLMMLKEFSLNKSINSDSVNINQLTQNGLISFYFVPLETFGLSDELYVRMNARGKILTDFENFKSEFYKIINYYPNLEEVKDKMEYAWVDNLWKYRQEKSYVIDDCFMNLLGFVTEMLYFKSEKPHNESGYEKNFLDYRVLKNIYTNKENADFLFFVLDSIPIIESLNKRKYFWKRDRSMKLTLANIFSKIAKDRTLETDEKFVLYFAFEYLQANSSSVKEIENYLRIVRNLIVNTQDNSIREWPRIMKSLSSLHDQGNVYSNLIKRPVLPGLRNEQCEEEYFKAQLIVNDPEIESLISEIEDNGYWTGNITNILSSCFVKKEDEIRSFVLASADISMFSKERLSIIYDSYKVLSKDDFNEVFGELLNSSLYTHQTYNCRLLSDDEYGKNPAIVAMSIDFCDSKFDNIEDYLISIDKLYIKNLSKKYEDFSQIRNVKEQLRLLYIMSIRLLDQKYDQFFKGSWNFGWLEKETGFTSMFTNGIENDPYWEERYNANPIFQTYNWQFRYNLGLKKEHALDIEIVGGGKPQKAFDKIIEWANN